MTQKEKFLKEVVILYDTREQENTHILQWLDEYNIKYERRKLDIGDYSFLAEGKDFSQSCVIERKKDIDELYGSTQQGRERVEREFNAGCKTINQFVLLIENCKSWEHLKGFCITDKQLQSQNRKIKEIGKHCYHTLRSWECGNRYNFRTLFVKDNKDTAKVMLEQFYYYWRNYKELTKNRRFDR